MKPASNNGITPGDVELTKLRDHQRTQKRDGLQVELRLAIGKLDF